MKGKIHLVLVLLVVVNFSSCKDNAEGPLNNVSGKYPVALNNEWEYTTEQQYRFYDSDGNFTHDSAAQFSNSIVKITRVNQDIGNYKGLILFEEHFIDDPVTSQTWYQSNDTALIGIAYNASGRSVPILPKRAGKIHPTLSDLKIIGNSPALIYSKSSVSDTVLFYEVPREVLAYPLSIGKSWKELVFPFDRDRYISRRENVVINDVTYDCYVVESDWQYYNIEFTDYVSARFGLVKRVVTADSVALADTQHPDGNGNWIKLTTVSSLVRHNLSQ